MLSGEGQNFPPNLDESLYYLSQWGGSKSDRKIDKEVSMPRTEFARENTFQAAAFEPISRYLDYDYLPIHPY